MRAVPALQPGFPRVSPWPLPQHCVLAGLGNGLELSIKDRPLLPPLMTTLAELLIALELQNTRNFSQWEEGALLIYVVLASKYQTVPIPGLGLLRLSHRLIGEVICELEVL